MASKLEIASFRQVSERNRRCRIYVTGKIKTFWKTKIQIDTIEKRN